MKTAAEVAEDILQAHVMQEHWVRNTEQIRGLIVEAVEADRAQREDDGTIHAAVITALWDRAEGFEDGDQSTAASAAQWIEEEPDEFWEEFVGQMLDEIERRFR